MRKETRSMLQSWTHAGDIGSVLVANHALGGSFCRAAMRGRKLINLWCSGRGRSSASDFTYKHRGGARASSSRRLMVCAVRRTR